MRPIRIQRWSVRRVATAVGVVGGLLLVTLLTVTAFTPLQDVPVSKTPDCDPNDTLVLMAQAVPSAELLPCIASLPSGWTPVPGTVHTGEATFWLGTPMAGTQAVEITLQGYCATDGAERIPSDEVGAVRFERPIELRPRFSEIRTYVFPGGCVTYDFAFKPGAPSTLAFEVDSALTFFPRSELVAHVERVEDLSLCGRGAPPCPG